MSRKTNSRRILSALLAVLVSVPLFSANVAFADEDTGAADDSAAVTEESSSDDSSETALFVKQKTYSDYYDEISDMAHPDEEVYFSYVGASDDAQVEVGSYEGKDNVIIWSNEEGTLDFEVDVPKTGAYSIEMSY